MIFSVDVYEYIYTYIGVGYENFIYKSRDLTLCKECFGAVGAFVNSLLA